MAFNYVLDGSNNITTVSRVGTWQPDPPAEQLTWSEGIDADYSALWDECKRCPLARDGSYRYQLVDGAITPTATVADIDIPAGMAINADGTLYWL